MCMFHFAQGHWPAGISNWSNVRACSIVKKVYLGNDLTYDKQHTPNTESQSLMKFRAEIIREQSV